MGHLDVNAVSYFLPDGRPLLDGVSLRVGEGAKVALIAPNGTGKTTLSRIVSGDLTAAEGAVTRSGGLGVMRQFIGSVRDDSSVRDLLVSVAPAATRAAAAAVDKAETGMLEVDDEPDNCDEHRAGKPRDEAARALDRYELALASEQTFESLSGGQQARFQILLLELSGATLLLLDEPTDNLDLHSAEALEEGLEAFDGTVVAVTHDRWVAKGFDRFLVFGQDGSVYESDEPVWDEGRVRRPR